MCIRDRRLLEETKKLFPDKFVSSISSDNSKDFLKTMESLSNGEIDIIIGTQIISKGYHLPNLTLVGVIDADIGLASSDLRASEHTFQLLQQVSGRSGRDEKEGKAFIQTYYPHHPVIHSLVNNSRDEFTEAELFMRERSELPPYGRLANITVNKNAVPNDPRSPFVTSGLRVGTPAITTRGFQEAETIELTHWMTDILESLENGTSDTVIPEVKAKVLDICSRYPVYK